MTLDQWLNARGITTAEFGRRSGLGKQAVHKYRRGERFPTPENLLIIREATGGVVTADDFVDAAAAAKADGSRSGGTTADAA